jgi:hypothetical protein
MPFGAFRLNTLSLNLEEAIAGLFTEGTGTAPDTNTYTYTVGTAVTAATDVDYWTPEASYAYFNAESGGLASNPGINLVFARAGQLRRRLAYRSGTGTGTGLTQIAEVSIGGSYTGAPSRMFVVAPRYGQNSFPRGRYLMHSDGSAAIAGYFWNPASTTQNSASALLSWHSTATHQYFGGSMGNIGTSSSTFYYHEWYKDVSGNLRVAVNSVPQDLTSGYTETANLSISTSDYILSMKDCVKGLGSPANTRGVSFMFNVNQTTGRDELVICNGYVIERIENIFAYSGINSAATIDNIHSLSVNKSTNQGMISFWNNTTKKMDMAFFTVSCPDTTTINVTWGNLFTYTITGDSKPRLGKGNNQGRFVLTSISSTDTSLNVRTMNSTGINDLTVSNAASLSYADTIVEHTCLNRPIDNNGTDNTLFAGVLLANNTLTARAINRA